MNSVPTKPPWKRIHWFSPPRRESLVLNPVTGEWKETKHEEIEKLKESIQPYDKTELWDLAKRITNPYELISTHSTRLQLPKSICCLHPLSRSFFKMVEMLTHIDFFERHKKVIKLKSLHICEGPGGFMEAFHSMALTNKRTVHDCYGMTLKSTHTLIPGWKRATQFLQRNPHIKILYGPNKTGNIYEVENQDECVKIAGQSGFHLVTADGGFDFSDDFQAQEKNILRLLVCSAIILLQCVAVDGDVVLKFFDMNSQVTRDVVCLMASCFKSWTVYKPVTSRPCNSESYFLGKGGFFDKSYAIGVLKQIRDGLAAEDPVVYEKLLMENPFNKELLELQGERNNYQLEALKNVLEFCETHETVNHKSLWDKQHNLCVQWCHAFRMPTEYRMQL